MWLLAQLKKDRKNDEENVWPAIKKPVILSSSDGYFRFHFRFLKIFFVTTRDISYRLLIALKYNIAYGQTTKDDLQFHNCIIKLLNIPLKWAKRMKATTITTLLKRFIWVDFHCSWRRYDRCDWFSFIVLDANQIWDFLWLRDLKQQEKKVILTLMCVIRW